MPSGAKIFLTGAVFIYTLVYSFSINVLMNNDSRYYVEEWMKQNIVGGNATVLGIGYRHFLPRLENFRQPTRTWEINLHETDISRVKGMTDSEAAKRLLKDFGLGSHAKIIDPVDPSVQDLTQILAEIRPDYIVTLSEDETWFKGKKRAKAYEFFSRLNNGEAGYQLLLKYKSKPNWNLLNFDGIITGGPWINPEIKIFKKIIQKNGAPL
jgi:hypothetical protein